MTGQRCGRWTVLQEARKDGKHIGWLCRCDCGTERIITGWQLRNGGSKSCGCLSVELAKSRYNDLSGMRFGRLVAIERVENIGNKVAWKCICDCGNTVCVTGDGLHQGTTQSCGCLHSDVCREMLKTHGESKTPLYAIYQAMKRRCNDENDSHYKYYGGRGISVCDDWNDKHGYTAFRKWALSNGYIEGLTIDRIDNDKGYSPDNCRWVDVYTQSNNKSSNVFLSIGGETKTRTQWGRDIGVSGETVRKRLVRGWSMEEAVGLVERERDWIGSARKRHDAQYITANGTTKHLYDWSKETGINHGTIRSRLDRGWTPEEALGLVKRESPKGRYITMGGETKQLSEWARQYGMSPEALYGRLRAGWQEEDAIKTPIGMKRGWRGKINK